MPEQIIVKHEIDLGQLERLEKALKEFKESGDIKKIVRQLAEMGDLQDKINKKKQEEVGIIGKLLSETKKLKQEQKETQDTKRLKEINTRLRQIGTELKKNKETTTGWGKAVGSFAFKFNVLANVISNVAPAVTGKLNQALKGAINTITEFESAMAGVRAISQATDAEFKKLRQDAIRLGGSTIYTATAVSMLQMAYAKLGFSTQEILNATEATLSLAAATDEDLAKAALVAGSTIRAFNMDVIETQRVVDVMAKSFTSSALNLEHWRESMKFASSIAEGTGLSVEALSSAMQVLADRGIKGSIAGTSMKNILIRMGDSTSSLTRKIGFLVNSSETFLEALEELNKQGTTLTEVFAMTDRRAAPAMKILIEMADVVREVHEATLDATGSAKEMADIRMDTLKGSITILKSAWEGLVLSLEQGTNIFTVHLRSIVDWVTKVIMKVKELTLVDEEWMKQYGQFEGSKKVQEFAATLIDSKDKTKAISEELKRVQEEYDRILEDQKEIGRLTEINTKKIEKSVKFKIKSAKTLNEFLANLAVAQGRTTLSYDELLERMNKADEVRIREKESISVTSKAFKKQKEEIDKTAAALKGYGDELKLWLTREELKAKLEEYEKVLAGIPTKEEINIRKRTAEAVAEIAYEQRKSEIYAMEIGEEKTKELLIKALAEKTKLFLEAEIEKLEIIKKYYPDEEKLAEEKIKSLLAKIKNLGREEYEYLQDKAQKEIELRKKTADLIAEIVYEQQIRLIYAMEFGEVKTKKLLKEALNEKTRMVYEAEIEKLKALKEYLPEQIKFIEIQIKALQEKIKNIGIDIKEPEGFLARLFGITDADERKMIVQLKKLGNFALNQFRDIADQQKQLIDESIRRYDQQVNELQRSLEIQLELVKEGKANRLQQVQEELAETQRLRGQALIAQEKAMERQRKIENTIQALSLATTVAELLKASSKFGPAFPIIAGILIGVMFKLWSDYMGKIEGKLPRFAEGVVGFKGEGTETSDSNLVLMSRGETMTSAKRTKKYRNVLEGIHGDDINAIWEAVTNDRNFSSKHKTIVNIDLNKTNKLLGEIVQHNKEIPKNFGSYVEYEKEGVIYRIKFDDRKN